MSCPVVDFYENSRNGPTIRIDAQEISSVHVLVGWFVQPTGVASRRGCISLVGTEFQVFEFDRLVGVEVLFFGIEQEGGPGCPGVFEWHGTPDDWEDLRDLTIPLLHEMPAHQYLNDGLRDDAAIEVAIMEPRPAWLQRMLNTETSND